MNKLLTRFGASLCAACVCINSLAYAIGEEPNNDNYPWEHSGDLTWSDGAEIEYQNFWGTGWLNSGNFILSAADVDYSVLSCGGVRKVQSVKIHFTHADGDLDIKVYRLDGLLLGSSTGTVDDETIDVSTKNEDTVVLKVFGFNGATNTYRRLFKC